MKGKLILVLFYRPLYFVLKIILILFKKVLNPKLQSWIQLRGQNFDIVPDSGRPRFLFHASSGEIEYVKSLIRELKTLNIQVDIFVSYSSPSAFKLFENIKPFVTQFVPLPWDQPQAISKFLDQIKPHSLFFARTDLWPEFLFQLQKRRILTYVISYNPSLTFFNQLGIKYFLNATKALFCIHPQQVETLRSLLPTEVHVSAPGDTRFDQVFWRLQQDSKISTAWNFNYAVLGSTWPEDENEFLPILTEVLNSGLKIIWCPHETATTNIKRIQEIISAKNLKSICFSAAQQHPSEDFDIIIMDQIGYLADLYRNAAWAFVGGSFKEKVHSVMEPLCCAIPVITGPHIQNSPEALRYNRIVMNGLSVVQIVHNPDEFLAAVKKISAIHKIEFKKLLIGNLEQNRNATKKILQQIIRWTQESLNF